MSKEKPKTENAVVDLEDARVRLRSRSIQPTHESLSTDLEKVQGLIDQGLTGEARAILNSLLAQARNQPEVLAQARYALSIALQTQAHYGASLEAVAMYESPESRASLDPTLSVRLRVQIALASNYNGDHPKAISLLQSELRGLPDKGPEVGAVYAALARVYRTLIGRWIVIARAATGAVWLRRTSV